MDALCHAVAMTMLSFLGGCWLYIYFQTCQYYPSFDFSNPVFRNNLARSILKCCYKCMNLSETSSSDARASVIPSVRQSVAAIRLSRYRRSFQPSPAIVQARRSLFLRYLISFFAAVLSSASLSPPLPWQSMARTDRSWSSQWSW